MKANVRMIALMAALAVMLVTGIAAQQAGTDKAVDPVCGMTVVKANAKATFDYKGTTYYFCNAGCKEAFAKEPEKYLKAQQEKAAVPMGQMGQMGQMGMRGQMMPCAGMMHGRMPMMSGRMGMMPGRMDHAGHPMMGPSLGHLFRLYGDKIELAVENTKDGATFKITSKDPEVIKAIQVHMAEHLAMMKKAREANDSMTKK